MVRRRSVIFFLLLSAVWLFSCNVTRKLPAGSYLLTKNSVHIADKDSVEKKQRVLPSQLEQFIPLTQTPNKRIFGANFFLWVHNQSDTAKHNWFNRLLRKIGETPILYDSLETKTIVGEMELFMQAKGFYSATTTDSVFFKKKRAYVSYKVAAGAPYKIEAINYNFNDKPLEPIILDDTSNSLIKVGDLVDRTVLEKERSRISSMLENIGYYQFSVNNISYLIDTLGGDDRATITVNVNKSLIGNTKEDSKIYRIRNIYVNPNYQPTAIQNDSVKLDTIQYNGINYIYSDSRINVRPELLSSVISIYPNFVYDKKEIEYTSTRIVNLKLFKNVNILFKEVDPEGPAYVSFAGSGGNLPDSMLTTVEGDIDCTILCTPTMRQSYKIETEASTNANYTGLSLTVGYANKNIFKGAEIFDISAKTAYQFVRASGKKDSYEFGGTVSMTFVNLMLPFNISRYRRFYSTGTRFEASISTQRRPDYDRIISSFNFGYQWMKNKYIGYNFKPISISLVNVPWVNLDYLATITNPYLRNSYQSQLIFGMAGGFSYSTISTPRDHTFSVRVAAETSGNFLDLLTFSMNKNKSENFGETYHSIFNIRYAQYFRSDVNFSYHQKLSERSKLVYHLFVGGGYAYGNTKSLPFERMYFAGGSNSMRGWQVRALGPGLTPQVPRNAYPNQVGDIRFEANIEGRFPVFGPLKGAIFLDAGNIWSNGVGEQNDYARFRFNSFYKQLALNTGIGARFDFNFFVLRVDWGIQLRNPGWQAGHTWINSFKFHNTAVHFGIGYPF